MVIVTVELTAPTAARTTAVPTASARTTPVLETLAMVAPLSMLQTTTCPSTTAPDESFAIARPSADSPTVSEESLSEIATDATTGGGGAARTTTESPPETFLMVARISAARGRWPDDPQVGDGGDGALR
ncbi:MAG: hypothetical protein IPK33_24700 [Gemmatimonadetes bacterium]|nr:hypothetical protein [Gemmatimonadota bacterium]